MDIRNEIQILMKKLETEEGINSLKAIRRISIVAKEISTEETTKSKKEKIERQSKTDPVLAFLNSIEVELKPYCNISEDDYKKLVHIVETNGHGVLVDGRSGHKIDSLDPTRVYFPRSIFETSRNGHRYTYRPGIGWDRYGNK